MGLNLTSLSSFNPQAVFTKAAIYVAAISVVFSAGSFVGYRYAVNSMAAEKLKESENARRAENTDRTQGNTAAAEVRRKENEILGLGKAASDEVGKKPVVVVKWKTKSCPEPIPSGVKEPNETPQSVPSVDFSAHFERLYDLPFTSGRSDIRAGTYEEAQTIPVDEGLQKIIIPNNANCAAIAEQLSALIDRIHQKQQLFGHKE